MTQYKWLVTVTSLLLLIGQATIAADRPQILGAWKLVSWEREVQATSARLSSFGKNPTGYLIFTTEGRMMQIVTGEGRKTPNTETERAALLDSMTAFTGRFRLEGDIYVAKFDVAWHPERVGVEVTNSFRIDGDRLHVTGDWTPTVATGKTLMGRTITVWQREK